MCRGSANYPAKYWPGMYSNDLVEGTIFFAKDVASCCMACRNTAYCVAWSFTNHANWCWLKGTRRFSGQMVVNGVRLNSSITVTFGTWGQIDMMMSRLVL